MPARAGGGPWDDTLILRLRALWDEGHSLTEIGRRLGVTKNAVSSKARHLDMPKRPSPIHRGAPKPRSSRRARAGASTLPPLASETDAT